MWALHMAATILNPTLVTSGLTDGLIFRWTQAITEVDVFSSSEADCSSTEEHDTLRETQPTAVVTGPLISVPCFLFRQCSGRRKTGIGCDIRHAPRLMMPQPYCNSHCYRRPANSTVEWRVSGPIHLLPVADAIRSTLYLFRSPMLNVNQWQYIQLRQAPP